ncbi:metallophosphoesterase family protein [Halogeometricum borinquense]|uniref:metallophosphoesterase family protein n=1 Tax=Halogeometricum borinquense TaxID=60847 RepID=UPI003444C026
MRDGSTGVSADQRTPPAADAGPLLARLRQPTSHTRTRIAVVSDPHLTPTATGTWKVYHRTETRLRAAVAAINDLNVDATLSLGDLTRDGHPEEFDCVDELLADLDTPFVSVPGNHDVPKQWDDYEAPTVDEFGARYARGAFPFHVSVGGVDLIGLDTASGDGTLYDSHEGLVPSEHVAWLDETLSEVESPIVASHHNVFHPREHTGQFADEDFYQLRNADEVVETLSSGGESLVLSGHIHWPATARQGGVREIIAPATCSFPQAAMLLDVGPLGTEVRMVPLAGPNGVAEAYSLAQTGNAHGQSIVSHADRGVLADFPLVDEFEWTANTCADVAADVPGAVRWR